jgi:hypothetical protein
MRRIYWHYRNDFIGSDQMIGIGSEFLIGPTRRLRALGGRVSQGHPINAGRRPSLRSLREGMRGKNTGPQGQRVLL